MADISTYENGEIYAQGDKIMVAPKRTGRGFTLGGTLATADSEKVAAEIARRCQTHPGLLAAAQEALEWIQARSSGVVLDVKDSLRAAIRNAGGDAC